MGLAKRQLEQQWEQGWSPVGTYVCPDCITEGALAELVAATVRNGGDVADECSYCEATDTAAIAAPVEVVLEAIVQGLRAEYGDPDNEGVLWSSADGGYQMPTYDTWDLLDEFEVTENDDLRSDITNAIDQAWCQRSPYRPAPHQALLWGWEGFREHVIHRARYTFVLPSTDADEQRGWGEIPPEDMPQALLDAIADGGLASVLPTGTLWVRARVHPNDESYTKAKDIGSPPSASAKTNRMSAAGISAFYGATTEAGALAEVAGYADPDDLASVGTFETARPFPIIDLVDLPLVPSLFDERRRHLRPALRFLHDFARDVARVTNPDDKLHLDYVPTQVVAEYLHRVFPHPSGQTIGVIWRSSKDPSVTCCVFSSATTGASRSSPDGKTIRRRGLA